MAGFKLEHKFDPSRKRHYLNGQLSVFHCHHYATLFTQLGIDAHDIVDGTRILRETVEDVFYGILSDYYKANNVADPKDRIDIACQMYAAVGLGKMVPVSPGETGGSIEMPHAHVDEGWIKKWGKYKAPVNFIGAGYIAGMFSATYGKPVRTYKVTETQSLVMGAAKSVFKVVM
jgi:hypothetical protein